MKRFFFQIKEKKLFFHRFAISVGQLIGKNNNQPGGLAPLLLLACNNGDGSASTSLGLGILDTQQSTGVGRVGRRSDGNYPGPLVVGGIRRPMAPLPCRARLPIQQPRL